MVGHDTSVTGACAPQPPRAVRRAECLCNWLALLALLASCIVWAAPPG